jgi:anaerobic dimethyl sulfoxide reductase subunit B (iron-sulfur subunit)
MEKPMQRQYGFYFDSDRCVQCHACEVACKSWNELELGIQWRRVLDLWGGQFPKVTNKTISSSCMHCAKPACVEICPARAISKRAEDGIVVVDQSKCTGCRSCSAACPFHVPQYGRSGIMQKCNFCLERLEQRKQPSCVATCPGEALKFGPIENLAGGSEPRPAQRLSGLTDPSFFISGRLTGTDLSALLKPGK